jgi:hypothetical protein
MGVPLDLDQLADSGVLSGEGLARVRRSATSADATSDGDVSVGDLVAARLGDEVVDRLVEPLLGGVYAGRARELSARATVPSWSLCSTRPAARRLGPPSRRPGLRRAARRHGRAGRRARAPAVPSRSAPGDGPRAAPRERWRRDRSR